MSANQLREIIARERNATPEPWQQDTDQEGYVVAPRLPVKKEYQTRIVADCDDQPIEAANANAAFIAAARQDIPQLLAWLREYGTHTIDCPGPGCTCGWSEMAAALEVLRELKSPGVRWVEE